MKTLTRHKERTDLFFFRPLKKYLRYQMLTPICYIFGCAHIHSATANCVPNIYKLRALLKSSPQLFFQGFFINITVTPPPFPLYSPTPEANIRVGGKTVLVVFKYLSRSLRKGWGDGRSKASPPHHHSIS